MRIRTTLILVCCSVAVVTAILFWLWPQADLRDFEVTHAEDRHQRIADDIASRLAEFGNDIVHIVEHTAWDDEKGIGAPSDTMATILKSKGIRGVCVYNAATGQLIRQTSLDARVCADVDPHDEQQNQSTTLLSPLKFDADGRPVLCIFRARGNELAVGVVSPDYVENIGNSVRFGVLGHVAIVDQTGTILSHPKPSWLNERRDLAGIEAFGNTLNGFSGTQRFYSPALEAEMIAGSAPVPGLEWAVLVPQPVAEIRSIVQHYDNVGLIVLFIGLALAVVVAAILGYLIADPLAQVTRAAKRVSEGHLDSEFPRLDHRFVPKEIRATNRAIHDMSRRLRDNADELHVLAHTDGLTGMHNRQHFMDASNDVLRQAREHDTPVALIFIDLDGFKKINDTHGHRVGDELLQTTAGRLRVGIEQWEAQASSETNITVARLGGDEFALLVPGRSLDSVLRLADSLHEKISQPVTALKSIRVGCSMGIAFNEDRDIALVDLMHEADGAMYAAKSSGQSPKIAGAYPTEVSIEA